MPLVPDPFSSAPRHPDQTRWESSYGSEEAALKSTLRRLFSRDGYVPRKVGLEASAICDEGNPSEEIDEDG
jgi:hypothetical protein